MCKKLFLGFVVLLVIAAVSQAALQAGKEDSSAFAVKHEMTGNPTLDGLTWAGAAGGGIYSSDTPGVGFMTIDTMPSTASGFFDEGEPWTSSDFEESGGFTYELRTRILDASPEETGGLLIMATAEFPQLVGDLSIKQHAVNLWAKAGGYGEWLETGDNTLAYHAFRVAVDAVGNRTYLWRDGVLIASCVNAPYGGTYLRLGDLSGQPVSQNARAEVDYFRWDAGGAYNVPEPATLALLGIGGLVAISRRRASKK